MLKGKSRSAGDVGSNNNGLNTPCPHSCRTLIGSSWSRSHPLERLFFLDRPRSLPRSLPYPGNLMGRPIIARGLVGIVGARVRPPSFCSPHLTDKPSTVRFKTRSTNSKVLSIIRCSRSTTSTAITCTLKMWL